VGDASDEVPGVPGIGKKSATELLQRFASLDALYGDLGGVTSARVRNALVAGRESAWLSRDLVTLRDDAAVTLDLDACRLDRFDRDAAARTLRDLGFQGLADRLGRLA
jgi:DNA polymerase-1